MATLSVGDLCEQHGITLEQLTDLCGISKERVLAIVLGRWTPRPDERKKIADVFELTPGEITWGHKTPIQHIYGHGPG